MWVCNVMHSRWCCRLLPLSTFPLSSPSLLHLILPRHLNFQWTFISTQRVDNNNTINTTYILHTMIMMTMSCWTFYGFFNSHSTRSLSTALTTFKLFYRSVLFLWQSIINFVIHSMTFLIKTREWVEKTIHLHRLSVPSPFSLTSSLRLSSAKEL